jgi:DNA modification methylase
MEIDILNGDCIEMMKTLPDNCVDTCVTSPPYWGLRDYGGDGKVWGAPECYERGEGDTSHEWEGYTRPSENTRNNNNSLQLKSAYWNPQEQAFCKHCDSWFGQLGLEPTIDQYVKNMVEVFSHVRRILKPEGTLWLNLGDSYCAGQRKNGVKDNAGGDRGLPTNRRNQASGSLKNKDLVGVPWRVAFALQEAGWWLRQDIIWAKPNCMPESVKDRCTKNHEYMFLFAKSEKYYFDNEAIKENTVKKPDKRVSAFTYADNEDWAKDKDASRISKAKGIAEARTKNYAKRNKRSVWWVGPKPFPEAHFAVFPIELIEPCILAGSPVGGTVFDPFGGSGTTGIAAIKHGRNAILTELSEKYIEIAEKRISDFKAQQGLDKKHVEWL